MKFNKINKINLKNQYWIKFVFFGQPQVTHFMPLVSFYTP